MTRSRRPLAALLLPLLLNPAQAEPFLWDGDCLTHPGTLSNRWNVQCQIEVRSTLTLTGNTRIHRGVFTVLTAAAVSGPSANPDRDTLTNLLEFAFGLDPKSPGPSPLTVAHDPQTDTLRLSFPWADQRPGLTRTFFTSPDLETSTRTQATLVDSQPEGTATRLHFGLPATNPFARLEVTLDP